MTSLLWSQDSEEERLGSKGLEARRPRPRQQTPGCGGLQGACGFSAQVLLQHWQSGTVGVEAKREVEWVRSEKGQWQGEPRPPVGRG